MFELWMTRTLILMWLQHKKALRECLRIWFLMMPCLISIVVPKKHLLNENINSPRRMKTFVVCYYKKTFVVCSFFFTKVLFVLVTFFYWSKFYITSLIELTMFFIRFSFVKFKEYREKLTYPLQFYMLPI